MSIMQDLWLPYEGNEAEFAVEVNGDVYGNIGGSNNSVVNFVSDDYDPNKLYYGTSEDNESFNMAIFNICTLDMFQKFALYVDDCIRYRVEQKIHPIKVDITEMLDYSTRILYQNNMAYDILAWYLVIFVFSIICGINNWNYYRKVEHVGTRCFLALC